MPEFENGFLQATLDNAFKTAAMKSFILIWRKFVALVKGTKQM